MSQPETSKTDCWSFFDKIYCISLDSRSDRRKMAKAQFAAHGLAERVEFVIVSRHPTNPEKGIFDSHMQCLNKGIGEDAKNILVFEDDIFFKSVDHLSLHRACTFLHNTTNWNGLFLGCLTTGITKTEEKALVKINYRCLAHAYALQRSFAEQIVKQTWAGIPFDELLRRNNENFYAFSPMCAFQGLAGTDNKRLAIARIRTILGGLPFIQRSNEIYQHHKIPLLIAPMALMLGIAILLFKAW